MSLLLFLLHLHLLLAAAAVVVMGGIAVVAAAVASAVIFTVKSICSRQKQHLILLYATWAGPFSWPQRSSNSLYPCPHS